MSRIVKKFLQLFFLIIVCVFFFDAYDVFASTHEITLTKVNGLSGNKLIADYPFAQSMTITDKYFVIVFTNSDNTGNALYVVDKKTKNFYKKVITPHCGHGNGVTYNPDDNVVVCVDSSKKTFAVFDAENFNFIKKVDNGINANNISYDQDTKTYWAVRNEGLGIYQFDTNFTLLKKVSSSEIESYDYVAKDSNGNDKIVPYRINQDSVIHNGYIYLINYPGTVGPDGYKRMHPNVKATDAIFLTYNLSTWKKGDVIFNSRSNRDGIDITEIEDLAFDGEKPYLLYKMGEKFQIFTVTKKSQNVNAKVVAKVNTNNMEGFKKLNMKATFKNTYTNFTLDKTVTFNSSYTVSNIALNKTGNYKLEIKQGTTSSRNWSIDNKTMYAVIHVCCGLELDNMNYYVTYSGGNNKFDNTFSYSPINVPIGVDSVTTKPSEYSLETTAELYKDSKKVESVKESNGKYTFSKIRISTPGTYKYEIKQSNAGTSVDGIYTRTIDSSTITATITVTGDDEKLSYKVTYSKNAFTNNVSANYNTVNNNINVNIKTNKSSSSDPTPATKMYVYKGTSLIDTINSSNDKYSFNISVSSPGTYKYKLKQDASITGSGIYSYTIDTTTIDLTVTATVSDNTLTTSVYLSKDLFTNKVVANYSEINVPIQVGINNVSNPSNVAFPSTSATISGNGVSATLNSRDGYYTYTLTLNKEGTYTYKIKQKNISSTDNYDYDIDDTVITVSVSVYSNNGVLTSIVNYSKNTFNNSLTVNSDPVHLSFSINVNTISSNLDVSVPTTSATLYNSDNSVVKTVNVSKEKYTFSGIDIDTPGTYTYTVKQNEISNPNLTLDNSTITITVVVTQDGPDLSSKISYSSRVFENSYTYKYGSINVDIVYNTHNTITATKNLTPTASIYQNNELVATAEENDNKYSFKIPYSEPGTYRYTVTQNSCGTKRSDNIISSIDCDVKELVISISPSGTSLSSNIVYRYGDNTFENEYVYSSSAINIPISIPIRTSLFNSNAVIPNTRATISAINNNGNSEVIETVNNTGNKYIFNEIEVLLPGTYSYTIVQEDAGERKDDIYVYYISKTILVVKVVVREENNKLVYDIDTKGLEFVNTADIDYEPVNVPLSVNIINNVNGDIDIPFTSIMFAGEDRVFDIISGGEGINTTNSIYIKRPGEYKYYIYMKKPYSYVKDNINVQLDSDKIYAFVNVDGDSNNVLHYSIRYKKGSIEDQNVMSLTNTYSLKNESSPEISSINTPIVIDIFSNSNQLSNLPVEATLFENDLPIETVSNSNGRYHFESLRFTDVGKYKFKIKQLQLENTDWSIDDEVIDLEVDVYRNADNSLNYRIIYENDVSSFTNNDDTVLTSIEERQENYNAPQILTNVPDTALFKDHFIEIIGIILFILGSFVFYKNIVVKE